MSPSPTFLKGKCIHLPLVAPILHRTFVVPMITLGSMLLVFFMLSMESCAIGFKEEFEYFSTSNNHCSVQHSPILCQGLLWQSCQIPMSFLNFHSSSLHVDLTSCIGVDKIFFNICSKSQGHLYPLCVVADFKTQILC